MNWIQPDGESATKKKKGCVGRVESSSLTLFSLERAAKEKPGTYRRFWQDGKKTKDCQENSILPKGRPWGVEDPSWLQVRPWSRNTRWCPGTGVLQPLSVSPGLLQPHGWSGGDNTCVTSFAGNWLFSCCLLLLCRSYLFRIASSLSLAVVLTTGCKGEAGEMLHIREGCVHGWVLAVSSCRSIAEAGAGLLSGRG